MALAKFNLKQWLPRPARAPGTSGGKAPTRQELLALRPLRNPSLQWEETDGHVVLHLVRRSDWRTRLLNIFLPLPNRRTVVLDEIGTHVWRQLDGTATFGAVVKSLAVEYKLNPREAELAVQQYFKELGRRGFVAFAAPNANVGSANQPSPASPRPGKHGSAKQA